MSLVAQRRDRTSTTMEVQALAAAGRRPRSPRRAQRTPFPGRPASQPYGVAWPNRSAICPFGRLCRIRSLATVLDMDRSIDGDIPDPVAAADHFARRLRFETDCDDVANAMASAGSEFTVIDARSREAYAAGHVPGSLNLERPFVAAEVAALPP